jgi:hypothetical protein
MTRYNNPLPQTSARPAHVPPEADAHAWGVPQTQPPRHQHPQGFSDHGGYADPNGYVADPRGAQPHDPFQALRPDGYGYQQPQAQVAQPHADPYGLAGYTAPQPQLATPQGYGARPAQPAPQYASPAQQPAYDPYAPYGHAAQQPPLPQAPQQPLAPPAQTYAPQPPLPQSGYAMPPQQPATSYGYAAPLQTGGYAPSRGPDALNQLADSWGSGAPDPHGFGHAAPGAGAAGLAPHHWDGADQYGTQGYEPSLGGPAPYPPQAQGSFDQSYADDDAQYEAEPRRGGSWKKAAVLVACTVVVGGALTYGYSAIMGSGSGDATPLVKTAQGPAKVKPSEPGGKQFAHADSKILGRLGGDGAPDPADTGDTGVRKVPVLTVGRDGSIQPPPSAAPREEAEARAEVSVPGLTVIDGPGAGSSSSQASGSQGSGGQNSSAQSSASSSKTAPPAQMVTAAEPQKAVVVSPPDKPKKSQNLVAAADLDAGAAAPTKTATQKPKKEKVAALAPPVTSDAPPVGPQPTGAGYVAVLASVPASDRSRIDALKQFADMQQKYGGILQNKTPDVQEANLGAKGTYHRLLVGPPGSRDSASQVCSQLKAEGYSGCWVTAY